MTGNDPQETRGQETDPRSIHTALTVGPVLTCVGIAWTAMAPSTMSSAAVLVGFATAMWGTHKFGRQGAERPVSFDALDSLDSDQANAAP